MELVAQDEERGREALTSAVAAPVVGQPVLPANAPALNESIETTQGGSAGSEEAGGEEEGGERNPEVAREQEATSEVAEGSLGGPFGGLSPAEAARRGAQRRKEARIAAEAAAKREADLARLSIRERAGIAAAEALSTDELRLVMRAQMDKALTGNKDGSSELRAWLKLVSELDVEPTGDDDETDFAKMSPTKRSAVRAHLMAQAEREAMALEGQAGQEGAGGDTHPPAA